MEQTIEMPATEEIEQITDNQMEVEETTGNVTETDEMPERIIVKEEKTDEEIVEITETPSETGESNTEEAKPAEAMDVVEEAENPAEAHPVEAEAPNPTRKKIREDQRRRRQEQRDFAIEQEKQQRKFVLRLQQMNEEEATLAEILCTLIYSNPQELKDVMKDLSQETLSLIASLRKKNSTSLDENSVLFRALLGAHSVIWHDGTLMGRENLQNPLLQIVLTGDKMTLKVLQSMRMAAYTPSSNRSGGQSAEGKLASFGNLA